MIVVNDRRPIKPENGILDFKKMLLKVLYLVLIGGLIDNDGKLT